jgi:hypothetical protein
MAPPPKETDEERANEWLVVEFPVLSWRARAWLFVFGRSSIRYAGVIEKMAGRRPAILRRSIGAAAEQRSQFCASERLSSNSFTWRSTWSATTTWPSAVGWKAPL